MILAWASPFNFAEMEAILDFTHHAMSKIISGHTIMSGIHEKSMLDTKIIYLLIS